jgi:hypothetical protein
MRNLSKDFFEKMNNKFGEILFENDQILFIRDKETKAKVESIDYSRVFFDCTFEIFKKNKGNRDVSLVDTDKFEVVNEEGELFVSYTINQGDRALDLSKAQLEQVLIDSCGKVYKIDKATSRAVPADVNIGLKAIMV